jgi:hypothetical protein
MRETIERWPELSAAALDERELILARGDCRDFVVIDLAGGDHYDG